VAPQTLRLGGVCNDIGKLTNVNFRYIHTLEDIHIPFSCNRELCRGKAPAQQAGFCQELLNLTARKAKFTQSVETCTFKCKLTRLVFPVFNNGVFCGMVISDDIKQNQGPDQVERQTSVPSLDAKQIDSLASILKANRSVLQEEVTSHRRFFPGSKSQDVIGQARKFTESNYYNSRLSLKDVADEIHTSYFHLCRLFKKETGICFVEYLTLFRLKKALRMLENRKLTMAQISYATGFSEAQYFSRIFKKYFRCRPSGYRLYTSRKKNELKRKVLSSLDVL